MLIGKKCKVGNRLDHNKKDFRFYDAIIASEAHMANEDEFKLLVINDGKLVIVDTYFIYDLEIDDE